MNIRVQTVKARIGNCRVLAQQACLCALWLAGTATARAQKPARDGVACGPITTGSTALALTSTVAFSYNTVQLASPLDRCDLNGIAASRRHSAFVDNRSVDVFREDVSANSLVAPRSDSWRNTERSFMPSEPSHRTLFASAYHSPSHPPYFTEFDDDTLEASPSAHRFSLSNTSIETPPVSGRFDGFLRWVHTTAQRLSEAAYWAPAHSKMKKTVLTCHLNLRGRTVGLLGVTNYWSF